MVRLLPFFLALACAGCWVPLYDDEPRPVARNVDYGDPLTCAEIEKLLKAGVSDGVILEKSKKTGVVKLTVDDIVALKTAGASDALIKELIASERRVSRVEYAPATTTYVYHDCWWGPSIWLGTSGHGYYHRHHHRRSGGFGVGVRVGW